MSFFVSFLTKKSRNIYKHSWCVRVRCWTQPVGTRHNPFRSVQTRRNPFRSVQTRLNMSKHVTTCRNTLQSVQTCWNTFPADVFSIFYFLFSILYLRKNSPSPGPVLYKGNISKSKSKSIFGIGGLV